MRALRHAEALGQHGDQAIAEGFGAFGVAQELFGRGHVKLKLAPSMGGEDFSFFTEKVPGAFYHIGCSPIDRMPAPALHSQHFCADERCIHQGLMMQMGIVLTETGTEL